jgi:hypothetical protein
MRPHAGRAIVAGFAATTAMTFALYVLVSVLAEQPLDSAMLGGAVAWMPAMVLQFDVPVYNGSIPVLERLNLGHQPYWIVELDPAGSSSVGPRKFTGA